MGLPTSTAALVLVKALLEQDMLNEEWSVKESSERPKPATPEAGTAHGSICGVKGLALSEMRRMRVPPCKACGHFRKETLEFLRGVARDA